MRINLTGNLTSQRSADRVQPVTAPETALEPACSPSLVASMLWLNDASGLPPSELTLIDTLILAATKRAREYTGFEHASRVIELRFDTHPDRQSAMGGMDVTPGLLSEWLESPFWPVQSIETYDVGGDTAEAVKVDETGAQSAINVIGTDFASRPPRIKLGSRYTDLDGAMGSIRVKLKTGPSVATDVESYQLAVAKMAAYMWQNRGVAASVAMRESGAAELLRDYRLMLVVA